MTPPLLEVNDLAKAYGGVQAVRGVSFRLERGEILALIGPNGAGKSTCFDMLNGQTTPSGGRIRIGGTDIRGMRPARVCRLGVGRTFQITATFGSMTVRQNVQTALFAHHRRVAAVLHRAESLYRTEALALLELIGMGAAAERPCGELAYGDLKRLELAVALANDPALLLMDEPTAGMAPRERVQLMRLVAAIARERNIGVLFTEHDMDTVFEHAHRIMVLDRGRLIADGSPTAIRNHPEVKAVYLGQGLLYAPEDRAP